MLRLFLLALAVGGLTHCAAVPQSAQQRPINLPYHVKDGEKVLDLASSAGWPPHWQDSLVARLERGTLPALDQDNRPVAPDSLPRARRLRGVVLVQGDDGVLRDGLLLHLPQEVRAYVPARPSQPAVDFYFYDRAIALELFYARVPLPMLEKLAGRPVQISRAR